MFKTQRFQPFQVTSTPLSVKHFTSHKVPFLFLGCFGVFWGTQAIPVTVPGMMFYHCMKESMFPNFSKRYCSMVHATNFDTPSYVREKGHIPGHNFEFSTPIRLSAYHYPSHMHLYLTSIAYMSTTLAEDHVSTVTITTAWTSTTGRRGAGFDIDAQTKSHSPVHHFLSSGEWFQSVSTPMLHHFEGRFGIDLAWNYSTDSCLHKG